VRHKFLENDVIVCRFFFSWAKIIRRNRVRTCLNKRTARATNTKRKRNRKITKYALRTAMSTTKNTDTHMDAYTQVVSQKQEYGNSKTKKKETETVIIDI